MFRFGSPEYLYLLLLLPLMVVLFSLCGKGASPCFGALRGSGSAPEIDARGFAGTTQITFCIVDVGHTVYDFGFGTSSVWLEIA